MYRVAQGRRTAGGWRGPQHGAGSRSDRALGDWLWTRLTLTGGEMVNPLSSFVGHGASLLAAGRAARKASVASAEQDGAPAAGRGTLGVPGGAIHIAPRAFLHETWRRKQRRSRLRARYARQGSTVATWRAGGAAPSCFLPHDPAEPPPTACTPASAPSSEAQLLRKLLSLHATRDALVAAARSLPRRLHQPHTTCDAKSPDMRFRNSNELCLSP